MEKQNNFFVATKKCMTNLYDKPVFITVTTTDINKFTSVRMYLSTVEIDDINTKYNKKPKQESLNLYDIRPEAMTNYLRYNGRHFSKKLCNWAVSLIDKDYIAFNTKKEIEINKLLQRLKEMND